MYKGYIDNNQIEIVCYEEGWILESICKSLSKKLKELNPILIIKITNKPSGREGIIYFHFYYQIAKPVHNSRNIFYVTHIDKYHKALKLIELSKYNGEFFCVSEETASYVNNLLRDGNVYAIKPWSLHLKQIKKEKNRKITFGMFFRIYSDRRKGNFYIEDFIRKIILKNKNNKLIIYGSGFEKILEPIDTKNIKYINKEFKRSEYINYLKKCDYVIYFGKDEGSYSILDSSYLGIKVITINQGFHKDIPFKKGSHLVNKQKEIIEIAQTLTKRNFSSNKTITLKDLLNRKYPNKTKKDHLILKYLRSIILSKSNKKFKYIFWILDHLIYILIKNSKRFIKLFLRIN